MVQDAELRMSALTVQVVFAFAVFIKIHTPLHQLLNLLGCTTHHLLYGSRITYPVARYHSIVDMLLKVIHQQISY